MLLLYYITDRTQLASNEPSRRTRLLEKIGEAAQAGVEYIQLRERDLTSRQLEQLACEAMAQIANTRSRLLINSRMDVALAAGAHGVHLRSNDISAAEARSVWARSTGRTDCVVAVSCHSIDDVLSAERDGADFVVFGPVFGKQGSDAVPVGPEGLAAVSKATKIPVFALGGLTIENAPACKDAGATGIAAIRLFQDNDIAHVVERLR